MPEPTPQKRVARALVALRELDDPLVRLDATRRAREDVEQLELETVRAARAAGRTWTEIGALYNLTKQGAQQRFRRADRGRPGTTDAPPPV